MRNPFRRQPTPPAPAAVDQVDLSVWNGDGHDALTPIARPDSLGPVAHRLPSIDPDQAQATALVSQVISDLAARGALDAAHADVLDRWIDAQLRGWQDVVEGQAEQRRRVTARLVAVDIENLRRETDELRDLRRRKSMYQTAYEGWRATLMGQSNAHDPITVEVEEMKSAPVAAFDPPSAYLDTLLPESAATRTTDNAPDWLPDTAESGARSSERPGGSQEGTR